MKAPLFEEVGLTWKGREWVIPPREVLEAIGKVEDIITPGELGRFYERGTLPVSKLARAYAALLQHAGCEVTADEVYVSMFSGKDVKETALAAAMQLQRMMIPPDSLLVPEKKAGGDEKEPAGAPSPSSSS